MSDDLNALNNGMKTLISFNRDLKQDITKVKQELALVQQFMIGLIVLFLILGVFVVNASGGGDKKFKNNDIVTPPVTAPMDPSTSPPVNQSMPAPSVNSPMQAAPSMNTQPVINSPMSNSQPAMNNSPMVNNNVSNQSPVMPNQPAGASMPNQQQQQYR